MKAVIIARLMQGPRLRGDIISEYSRQSSKGIYRHLRDLQSQKIIREVKGKGMKTLLVLNKRDLTAASLAFKYLIDARQRLRTAFDRAFVECAISAYGDFPAYVPYQDGVIGTDFTFATLNALIEGERPEVDATVMAKVMNAVEQIRGPLTVEDRLAYVSLVDRLARRDWSPNDSSPISLSASFLFSTAEYAKKSGHLKYPDEIEEVWNVVIPNIFRMAFDKRKNFLDNVKGTRELMLMTRRMKLGEASMLPLKDLADLDLNNKIDNLFLEERKKRAREEGTLQERN